MIISKCLELTNLRVFDEIWTSYFDNILTKHCQQLNNCAYILLNVFQNFRQGVTSLTHFTSLTVNFVKHLAETLLISVELTINVIIYMYLLLLLLVLLI